MRQCKIIRSFQNCLLPSFNNITSKSTCHDLEVFLNSRKKPVCVMLATCQVQLALCLQIYGIRIHRNYHTFIFKKQKLNDNIDFSINSIVFLLILVHNNNTFTHWEIGCMIRKCRHPTPYVFIENMDITSSRTQLFD